MDITSANARSPRWILDLIPGAAALQFSRVFLPSLHLTALEAGISAFLGCNAAIVLCVLLRTLAAKITRNRTVANVWGVVASLGLSAALIVGAAFAETPSPTGGEVSKQSDAPNGDFARAVSHAVSVRDDSVIVKTFVQNAEGASDADITAEEVGRWAAFLIKQAGLGAQRACVENGGDASTCAQIYGDEKHKVIQKDGRNVALIRINTHLGDTIAGRVLRVVALKGNELVSVACFRAGDKPIEPTMSPCAEEIKKSLGFTFQG